jgi:hypothetical protein
VMDYMLWNPSKQNIFEVKSLFCMLSSSVTQTSTFPWRSIWKSQFHCESISLWTATLGKILTLDNLCKRGIIVVELCCMCKQSGKSINHLLLHCEVARVLWSVLVSVLAWSVW